MNDQAVKLDEVMYILEAKKCSESRIKLRQWIMSIIFNFFVMSLGMAQGHTTILLQQISPLSVNATKNFIIENGNFFGIEDIVVESRELQSWIASILLLFSFPGSWILALIGKRVGRKPLFIGSMTVFTLAWGWIILARSASDLIIGRATMSFTIGILSGLTTIYQNECMCPKQRPVIYGLSSLFMSLGILLVHAFGTWLHWRTAALLCTIPSVFALLGNLIYVPESPVWLVNRGNLIQALHSWSFFRGNNDHDEFKDMLVKRKTELATKQQQQRLMERYWTPAFAKPLIIVFVLFGVGQFSGIGAVTFYCMQIIGKITGPGNANLPTLILDVFRVVASLGLPFLTRVYSMRTLTLFSALGSSLFLIILSLTLFIDVWMPWSSLFFLFCYEAIVVLGLMTLPWGFLGELFSPVHKEIGVSIGTTYFYLVLFLVIKLNPLMMATLLPWGTFMTFGILTLGGFVILRFILPETRNKSLGEIGSMFEPSNVVVQK